MIDREKLEGLVEKTSGFNVSIFIPTHDIEGEQRQQDPIRLKNTLRNIEKQLINDEGWKEEKTNEFLHEALSLVDDSDFWLHQDKGLAIYLNERHFEFFKLPFSPEEEYYTGKNFYITPLLPLQNGMEDFYILALNQGGTRFLHSRLDVINEIALEEVPTTMDEHLKYHVHERSVQQHTGTGNHRAMFHGQGGDTNEDDKELKLFLQHIENEVTSYMKKANQPLVLAGNEKLVAYYKNANHYHKTMDEFVRCNTVQKRDEELNEEARDIVEPFFMETLKEDIERFHDLSGSDKISADLTEVVKNAYYGKVDTLFVPMKVMRWGILNEKENRVDLAEREDEKSHELINFAAVSALKRGSRIYGLEIEEMPKNSELASIYRY